MLQQTTVKAVIPYYERFLERFPTVADLAAASEEEVLQYWEGLGYYSRGRNLRKAAIAIVEEFAGEFPKDVESLQSLPGIGRYTAGAIRSFAFDLPAPIVEANTLRLYCRLMNYQGDPRSSSGEKTLWAFAELLQPKRNASVINQSLMEIGSQVCTPVDPKCENCPVNQFCRAFAENNQHNVPKKKVRAKVTQVVEATVAIRSGRKLLVRRRQPAERWAGMWDFVRFPIDSINFNQKLGKRNLSQLLAEIDQTLAGDFSLAVEYPKLVKEIRHSVTRYRIRLICLQAELANSASKKKLGSEFDWVRPEQLSERPMPVTGREFLELLTD